MFLAIEKAAERYVICMQCEQFGNKTKMCKKCHCWMPGKVKLTNSKCPLGKWKENTNEQR